MSLIGQGEEQEDVPQFGVILLEQQFNLQQRTRLMTLALLLQDIFNRIQVRLGTLTWSDQRERELCPSVRLSLSGQSESQKEGQRLWRAVKR